MVSQSSQPPLQLNIKVMTITLTGLTQPCLVKNVPLPVVGRTLYLKYGVPLLQGTVFPDTTVDLSKASLSNHLSDMESVLVKTDGEARFKEGQRSVEVDISRVLSWVRLEVLNQSVVSSRVIRLKGHVI